MRKLQELTEILNVITKKDTHPFLTRQIYCNTLEKSSKYFVPIERLEMINTHSDLYNYVSEIECKYSENKKAGLICYMAYHNLLNRTMRMDERFITDFIIKITK